MARKCFCFSVSDSVHLAQADGSSSTTTPAWALSAAAAALDAPPPLVHVSELNEYLTTGVITIGPDAGKRPSFYPALRQALAASANRGTTTATAGRRPGAATAAGTTAAAPRRRPSQPAVGDTTQQTVTAAGVGRTVVHSEGGNGIAGGDAPVYHHQPGSSAGPSAAYYATPQLPAVAQNSTVVIRADKPPGQPAGQLPYFPPQVQQNPLPRQ